MEPFIHNEYLTEHSQMQLLWTPKEFPLQQRDHPIIRTPTFPDVPYEEAELAKKSKRKHLRFFPASNTHHTHPRTPTRYSPSHHQTTSSSSQQGAPTHPHTNRATNDQPYQPHHNPHHNSHHHHYNTPRSSSSPQHPYSHSSYNDRNNKRQ
jgi:hypothetical protein